MLVHIDNEVDDLYLCCSLPQYGFNMVMSHPHAVNEIALSLNNRNPRSVQHTRTTDYIQLQIPKATSAVDYKVHL